MKTVKRNFPVTGMGCAACVNRVQNTLREQKGVRTANVSLAGNMAQVEYDPSVATPAGLKKAVQEAGYDLLVEGTEDEAESDADRAQEESYKRLRKDTFLACEIGLIVMVVSMGFRDFPYKGLLLWALATPAVFWCGRRFFVTAWKQFRHGSANMDTLVALSVSISYLFSVFNLLFPQVWTSRGIGAHLYFDSSTMIVAFILLGRLLEERAKRSTTASLRKLTGLQPKTVTRLRDGKEETVQIAEVRRGDIVAVKPGERIAVDGKVTEGGSYVDESLLTGEPVGALKEAGDAVYAGTVNQRGAFRVEVEKTGGDTVLAAIIKLVRDAQGSRAPVQNLVDRMAAVFVPAIIGISLVSLLAWIVLAPEDGLTRGLLAMVTVLVIACPCSLGLATPTAIIAGIGKGAEQGILIKDAESLEVAKNVDVLVLDKTGTLTEGHPSAVDSVWDTETGEDWKSILYSLERKSEHPLAEAVVASLEGCAARPVTDFEAVTGKGVKGVIDGVRYYAGNRELLKETVEDGIPAASSPAVAESVNKWQNEGYTTIMLFNERRLYAVVAVADEIKPSSAEAVSALRRMGIEVCMLTGDNLGTASKIAERAGIGQVKANVLPQDKAHFIKELQGAGKCVAMAGDGINDSAALAQADLSIAMGKGSDIAIDSSMVTIVSSDLTKIPDMIRLSRRTVKIIRENLFWAFIYNILAVPIAAGVLYPVSGFLLNPMIAAACMALSSVCVVTNSLRLKL